MAPHRLRILVTFANSVDPDEMQHYDAFHQGLHCLQKYSWGLPNTKGLLCACWVILACFIVVC